jgi:chromosomal replication initiator protein
MEQVWNQVKSALKDTLGPTNYAIWIRSIQFVSHTTDQISLQVPNRYYRDWVQSNYGATLQSALRKELGYPITIQFQIGNEPPEAAPTAKTRAAEPQQLQMGSSSASKTRVFQESVASGVSIDNIFSNFVVGACNQFAHAASLAVAESPGDQQYNPLFIYGSTGLGKTHLLHAIGNHIKQDNPSAHILYVTAEGFTNDLIDALRYRRMSEFRERYRKQPTVLLMDDVQFLTGKDRTQEELFHTFEWLKERGRQIVFTSDVLPREIKMFEPRLRTRCESGMLADTQPPDMETMLAILHQKAENMEMNLSAELAQYIASRVRGNIRELEGVLNRLKALCRLHKSQPTIDFAEMYLGPALADEPHVLTPDEIIQTVANFFNIKVADIKGKRRLRQFVRPRHISMWMIREHTSLSFPDIGRVFNDRDHATVQHACKRVRGLLESDADTVNTIRLLQRNLGR